MQIPWKTATFPQVYTANQPHTYFFSSSFYIKHPYLHKNLKSPTNPKNNPSRLPKTKPTIKTNDPRDRFFIYTIAIVKKNKLKQPKKVLKNLSTKNMNNN